jgi:DNA-damage-inducible protein D
MKGREAMNKSAKTKPVAQNPTVSALEAIKQVDGAGNEFWSARELAKLLGYERWQNFERVIVEAKEVCAHEGGDVEQLFTASSKKSRGRDATDYSLTRHACYILDDGAGRGE